MRKKIKRFIGDLIEKIFKRKELLKFKTQADLLEKEVEEKVNIIKGQAEIISKITTGKYVHLTQYEKRMILTAIENPAFKDWLETPATKAQDRITWRDLREKMKLHLKEENDETRAGDNG